MTELRHEVRAFKVEYSCDQGDGGTMVSTGIEHKYTPTHQHRCTACGGVDYFHEKYPCIRYERVAVVADCPISVNMVMPSIRMLDIGVELTHAKMFAKCD